MSRIPEARPYPEGNEKELVEVSTEVVVTPEVHAFRNKGQWTEETRLPSRRELRPLVSDSLNRSDTRHAE